MGLQVATMNSKWNTCSKINYCNINMYSTYIYIYSVQKAVRNTISVQKTHPIPVPFTFFNEKPRHVFRMPILCAQLLVGTNKRSMEAGKSTFVPLINGKFCGGSFWPLKGNGIRYDYIRIMKK